MLGIRKDVIFGHFRTPQNSMANDLIAVLNQDVPGFPIAQHGQTDLLRDRHMQNFLIEILPLKNGLAVGVTEDLTGTYSAVDLVKVGAAALGGKGGGGRPDMAQAGGPDGSKAQAALEAIEAQLAG